MAERPDWNSPRFLDIARGLDLPALAQEFLCLNDAYQTGYRAAMADISAPVQSRRERLATFARPWGLRFPCRPGDPQLDTAGSVG
ncbi:transcriptional regulator domain-containing protein [Gluconacetobacter diazotrophicus]|uniref:transcriptional regulator domain-containing protein n=1 Tax=Gluconacetobacter diazotrophicus TaxID=33996 RepID=UPI001C7E9BAA